jgi:hypothetical protein
LLTYCWAGVKLSSWILLQISKEMRGIQENERQKAVFIYTIGVDVVILLVHM